MQNFDIEIHILRGRTTSGWQTAKNSVTDIGAEIKTIRNIGKTILEGRMAAYFNGKTEFVSYVDDDDVSYLNASHLEKMIEMAADRPVFSNSRKNQAILPGMITDFELNPIYVKKWDLLSEVAGIIKPHQTIVMKRSVAKEMFTAAANFITVKKLDPNCIDFVLRTFISKKYGWNYYPEVTYQWNLAKDSTCVELNKVLDYKKIRHQIIHNV